MEAGPYRGVFVLTVTDGEISNWDLAERDGLWREEMLPAFASWMEENHPEDDLENLHFHYVRPENLSFWEQYLPEYLASVEGSGSGSVNRPKRGPEAGPRFYVLGSALRHGTALMACAVPLEPMMLVIVTVEAPLRVISPFSSVTAISPPEAVGTVAISSRSKALRFSSAT